MNCPRTVSAPMAAMRTMPGRESVFATLVFGFEVELLVPSVGWMSVSTAVGADTEKAR